MSVTREQSIAMVGDERYTAWGEAEANADMKAKGLTAGSGGSSSGASIAPFTFDQAAAEKAAMEELRPYYEKLLQIYDGDVALAKKRMEADYERGLRYKKEETANATGDINDTKAENERKFKIALGDLDQEMNTRGLTSSGIKATEKQEAAADQAYTQEQLNNQARDLALSEKKYIEEQDVTKQQFLEDEGFVDTGITGYYNNKQKKQFGYTQEMIDKSKEMALAKRTQAANDYAVGTKPIAEATPTNYSELLNKALTTSGLPATS